MLKIIHIIQILSNGGAARSLTATAKYLNNTQQSVVSLLPADAFAIESARKAKMTVLEAPDKETLNRAIENADIVHIHFWNSPEMYALLQSELPAMRLLVKCNIGGDKPPHIITQELIDFADFVLTTSPYVYDIPILQKLPADIKWQKTGMIYGAADFGRLANLQPKLHDTFNVGYIGAVNFVKMHPNYIPMSAFIKIPNVRFIVCGAGANQLRKQALQLGVENRFDLRGYVKDIKPVLEILDVFGYPLCEDNYSTVELVLQEVMYAGIPPVIFSHGGAQRTVVHNYTGLIVNSELEYKEAIEYLCHYPEERARLGETAKQYARALFGGENSAKATYGVYQRLMKQPRHKREWGITPGVSALEQKVSVFDLIRQSDKPSGAELFIQSLGETAPQFTTSLTSPHIHELFEAEQKIALSSPVLCHKHGGGIFHYRNYYPDDGCLRLWAGLVLHQQGQYADAVTEFTAAINSGCEHWRIIWYLAQAAGKANQIALAEKMAHKVIRAVKDFQPAHDMLAHLGEINQKPIIKTPVQRLTDKIAKVCDNLKGKVILERGCDKEGQLISTLIKEYHAKEVIGIHHNHDSQAICKGGRIEKNADTSSFADNYFDLVISDSYQIPPLKNFLTEMFRVLKPNGFLYANIRPLWSCAWGHRLFARHQGKTYNFRNTVLPPYCHLLMTQKELSEHCLAHYEPELSEKMVASVFNFPDKHRLFFEDYEKIVNDSAFETLTFKGQVNKKLAKTYQPDNVEQTLTRLCEKYPQYQDFSSSEIHFVLKKMFDGSEAD
jgi:glycosyltransferase involved in cell wall biosynthesis/ubiquinone/menaquinone biosynthesis C-methylase UbiE